MTDKIIVLCRKCGSDDIRVDAYSSWNVTTQQWEHTSEHDAYVCENCGGECKVRNVPLSEYALDLGLRLLSKPALASIEAEADLENSFFDAVRLVVSPEQWTALENYNLKATEEERVKYAMDLLSPPVPAKDTPESLIREAYEEWPEFGTQDEVDGGDLVEWFADWWQRAKDVLERPMEKSMIVQNNTNAPVHVSIGGATTLNAHGLRPGQFVTLLVPTSDDRRRDFLNRLRVLMSIDRSDLADADISATDPVWSAFVTNPHVWFIRCGDDDAKKLWGIIERRAGAPAITPPPVDYAKRYAEAVDLLHDNQSAWEDEEESVQEEHDSLMEKNADFLMEDSRIKAGLVGGAPIEILNSAAPGA